MGDRRVVGAMVVAGTLGSLGCADDTLVQGEIRSGSRIRAVYWVDADGDRLFKGWFDRELGVECFWTYGAETRCLPAPWPATGFADASCTQPVGEIYRRENRCPNPELRYLTVQRDPCTPWSADEVWAIEPESVPVDTVYEYDPTARSCTAFPADSASKEYRRLTGPVDASQFVGGHVVDVGAGRIKTRTLVSDDGALAPGLPFDSELGVTCEPTWGRGCKPAAIGTPFAQDAACDQPLLLTRSDCEPPSLVISPRTSGRTYWHREALISDTPGATLAVFDMSMDGDTSCSPTHLEVPPGFAVYGPGDEITEQDLATSDLVEGTGVRIAPQWLVVGDHRQPNGYRDLAVGSACSPLQVAEGDWYCVPASLEVLRGWAYADAACTETKDLIVYRGEGDPSLPALDFGGSFTQCAARVRAFARGPRATYFHRDGSACLPGAGAFASYIEAYDLGPEVSFDMYAKLTPTIE